MVARQHRKRYSPEFRDEAVKMVLDTSRPIVDVARELGLNAGTLGNWVNQYRKEHPQDDHADLELSERAELLRLRDEVRDLRMKNEFLGKAAAFFAQEYR